MNAAMTMEGDAAVVFNVGVWLQMTYAWKPALRKDKMQPGSSRLMWNLQSNWSCTPNDEHLKTQDDERNI
jgi:hypothetical protein